MLTPKYLTFQNIGRFVEPQKIDFTRPANLVQVEGQNNNTKGSSGRTEMSHISVNHTNRIFGNLKAIKATEERRSGLIVWEMVCVKCHKYVYKIPSWLNENANCGNRECAIIKRRIKDFTDQTFGTLRAIRCTNKKKIKTFLWEFECQKCKSIVLRIPGHLGPTSYCGKTECGIGLITEDCNGRKFDKLTVLKFYGVSETKQILWNCKCDCGKMRIATTTQLIKGNVKSCGCNKIMASKRPPGEVSWNSRYNHFLDSSCKDRKLSNELTNQDFKFISSQNCFYCNIAPKPYNVYLNTDGAIRKGSKKGLSQLTIDRAWININGIDRIDNERGYSFDNCVPCCWECNLTKLKMSIHKWCAFIEKFSPGFTKKVMDGLNKLGITIPTKNN